MVTTRGAVLTLACVGALAISGCTSSRLGTVDTRSPAPLTPAPSGTVQSGQLPPPISPNPTIANAPTDGSAFPQAPISNNSQDLVTTGDGGTTDSIASTIDTSPSVTTAAVEPLTRDAMGGVWTATSAGSTCRIATSLTRGGSDFRAASLGCSGDLSEVGFWNLNGNQVVLKDRSGNQVATLFSSGGNQFNGQTSGGRAITLSR